MPRVTRDAAADAASAVPPGRWAVAVSGGADSVALLHLLHARPDLRLHVVHLDHETRAGASARDADFVRALCERLSLPCTVATRSRIESGQSQIESNLSARYRAARLALFREVVHANGLAGVILAHHADDHAETVLHRLLRGSGPAGLTGMSPRTLLGGLLVLRPLLGVTRAAIRAELRRRGESWREDESNASAEYARNRIRRLLSERPGLSEALLCLAAACRRLHDWTCAHTPAPDERLPMRDLMALPAPLQRELARRWLVRAGVPEGRIDPGVIRRLVVMAADVSTPPRQQFPSGVLVRRTRGTLSATRPSV